MCKGFIFIKKSVYIFMLNLNQVKVNKIYAIEDYQNLSDKILRRLCDLGLTKGEKVCVRRKSLLKKALLIELCGYTLSLKAEIAEGVIVK